MLALDGAWRLGRPDGPDDASAGSMHGPGDLLPTRHLLVGPDARGAGIAYAHGGDGPDAVGQDGHVELLRGGQVGGLGQGVGAVG